MLYPEKLKENEYIRMIALRRDKDGNVGQFAGCDVISAYPLSISFLFRINGD